VRLSGIVTLLLLPLWLFAYSGRVVDAESGKAIAGAKIFNGSQTVLSGADGSFQTEVRGETLHIKAYGYRALTVGSHISYSRFALRPLKVRALYVSFNAANPRSKTFKQILQKVENTGINALVLDVKNVKGEISYRTQVAEANRIGASRHRTIPDIHALLETLKSKHIYTIARIAVFKDTLQAKHFPSRAVKRSDGNIWWDKHHTAWIDPHSKEGREYTLAIAEDAAKAGFDEINFDYIRFPAHRGLRYRKADTQTHRIAAIESFLQSAQERLSPYSAYISVDIFGYVAWNRNDTHIGQTIPSLAKHSDYICPMLYPSGFHKGTLGYADPATHPYSIVKASIRKAQRDIDARRIRPWLQSFRDYAFSHVNYTEHHIAKQIEAANEMGTNGWMLWNPSSRYPYVNRNLFRKIDASSTGKEKKRP